MSITIACIAQLSDHDLLSSVQRAARDEREATAQLIALLMELDSRRLYLSEGYSSMFTYCTQILHFSEHAAYGRIEAARTARRFPVILDLLANGQINLTTVGLLSPHLTPENHKEILEESRHKAKREVEHLVARLRPRPDVPSVIRKLPEPKTLSLREETRVSTQAATAPATFAEAPLTHRPQVKPLAPERYKIQFTVGSETYDKLRRAQDLLRHTIPNGDVAAVFERALMLLVADLERRRLAATTRSRTAGRTNPRSRHVPAAVRRAVWQRDGGRCAFNGEQGRCTETGFLEFHHVVPFAAGGKTTSDNIELRCRAHNVYESEQHFGSRLPLLVREVRTEWPAKPFAYMWLRLRLRDDPDVRLRRLPSLRVLRFCVRV